MLRLPALLTLLLSPGFVCSSYGGVGARAGGDGGASGAGVALFCLGFLQLMSVNLLEHLFFDEERTCYRLAFPVSLAWA